MASAWEKKVSRERLNYKGSKVRHGGEERDGGITES